jgi:hypothetical protein
LGVNFTTTVLWALVAPARSPDFAAASPSSEPVDM